MSCPDSPPCASAPSRRSPRRWALTEGENFTELQGPPPGRLTGIEVDMADLSDVAQTLAVVAPFASSPTRVTGIGFIRRKETDRVGAVVHELSKLGVRAEEEADG